MTESSPKLCAILLGLADTPQSAAEHAQISARCPYVADYSASGCLTVGVYVLPESKRWWIEIATEQPHLLGLTKATLQFADFPDAASPWSRGEVKPELELPPCGTDCSRCPQYQVRCPGCPASRFYQEEGKG